METTFTQSGERVQVTSETRDLGHGEQTKVIYSDGSEGWEHVEDLECGDLGPLKEKLIEELNKLEINRWDQIYATMWVDASSIYWVVDSETFLFFDDHYGNNDFIDENHQMTELNHCPEGVGFEGVYWENIDFDSPYVKSDFEEKIQTVNI